MIDLVSLTDKAEKALRYLSLRVPARVLGSLTGYDVATVYGVCATDYDALLEDLKSVCSELSAARESKWISVKQDLPPNDEEVVLCNYKEGFMADNLIQIQTSTGAYVHQHPERFTHWQMLPAPPIRSRDR